MATKKTGISRDLIIHPGETIADLLDARNITQVDLANRTGVTPAFVSSVITGKKDISASFAMALEYVLGIPKSFWLNLQARYDAELLEADEVFTIKEEEKEVRKRLKDIVKYLRKIGLMNVREDAESSILALRKILKVSDLCNLKKISTVSAFRMGNAEHSDPFIIGAWIRLCQLNENKSAPVKIFEEINVAQLVDDLKKIMLNNRADLQKVIKDTLWQYGIDFEIMRNFKGAPVQGFIYRRTDGILKICMTIRGSFADIFWFSLLHEIGHIVNGDLNKTKSFIDDGTDKAKEDAANQFAGDHLIDNTQYYSFVVQHGRYYTKNAIDRFAQEQGIPAYIVIGRLQKDKHIPYNSVFTKYKLRYKWIEE